MLRHATIKIRVRGNASYKKKYDYYKQSLCSKVSSLNKSQMLHKASKFDVDVTYVQDDCLYSYVHIEDIPMYLEICKNSSEESCKLFLK